MNSSEYCLLSKDLLFLLKWICENNPNILKQIVSRAWKNGFKKTYELGEIDTMSEKEIEILKNTVLDFFNIIESNLNDCIKKDKKVICKEVSILTDMHKNIISQMETNDEDKIKSLYLLQKILKSNKDSQATREEIKDIFFKEFLAQWNPKTEFLN